MYLIVEFEGEGTTGPIAKSWYADGYSWWPPYKDLDRVLKSVRTMEEPQPEKGWTRHRTRILHESGKSKLYCKLNMILPSIPVFHCSESYFFFFYTVKCDLT